MYDDYFKADDEAKARGDRITVPLEEEELYDDEEEEEQMEVGKAQKGAETETETEENKSRQEVRSERMQKRIQRLEEANMSQAHWTMKGEVKASQRPANSLLEVDLDFQHAANPVIEPTQEIADEMDAIIKARISERRFDDVIPVVISEAPEDARTLNGEELDDKKANKGLAEIYESEYMQARGFSDIEDKQKRKQEACWTLYRSIAARLDAMSHFQFSPKPVMQEANESQANAPAIAMEEVGLEALSSAGTLAPGEVMKASSKGLLKADGEFEKEERKARRRANKKRRKSKQANETEAGQEKQKMGRKSAELEQQRKKNKYSQQGMSTMDLNDKKVRYSKSGDVFKLLQEQQEAAASQNPSSSNKKRKALRENKNALKL
jgi:U3 small nucleolar RNA-associated protein MPP10